MTASQSGPTWRSHLSLSLCLHVFFPGIGCDILDKVVNMTIDPDVDVTKYINNIQPFLPGEETARVAALMKECFLSQGEETLEKVQQLEVILVCL